MTHTEGKCKVDIIWIQFCHHEFWSRNDHWEIWQWLWMPLSWSWILGRVFCQSFLKDLAVQVNHVSWPVQTWWDWRLHWSSWLQSWANVGADMVGVEVECLPVCSGTGGGGSGSASCSWSWLDCFAWRMGQIQPFSELPIWHWMELWNPWVGSNQGQS